MGTCPELAHTFLVHQLCGKFLYALKFGGKSHCSRELLEKARLPLQSVSSLFPLPKIYTWHFIFFHYLPIFLLLFVAFIDAPFSFWSREIGTMLGSIFAIFSFAPAIRIPFVNVSWCHHHKHQLRMLFSRY